MPAPRGSKTAVERVERMCLRPLSERPLRLALLEEIRREVGFDWHAWLLTDPASEVGSAPIADTPSLADLPRLIAGKYLSSVNRWTSLPAAAVSLRDTTDGDLSLSRQWRDVLCGYGVADVASLVFRDGYGCWGWLDLWRGADAGPFDRGELAHLAAVVGPITGAIRAAQARSFDEGAAAAPHREPAVLVLSPDLDVRAQTAAVDEHLRSLVPSEGDRRPIPAGAYNVAAQLLAVEAGVDDHPATARVHLGGGAWLTLRAARVDSGAVPTDGDIAVTIEPTGPAERRDLYCRSHGLSRRETELVDLLAQGHDTRAVAAELFVSEHTVQDHLKSIFAKTGTNSRRTLLARLTGG